ncbi:Myb-related transcription factor, partner of profilin like, partial [Quillaja saponaria]
TFNFPLVPFLCSASASASRIQISNSFHTQLKEMNPIEYKSSSKSKQTLPPKRGQITMKIIKAVFKSAAALASGGRRRRKQDGALLSSNSTTPPIPSGYNSDS